MEKIKHLKQIIIVITMVFISTQVFSQFIPASVTESPFGTTVNGRATGNDILWKGGDVWEVSVWEDVNSNPGFGYNVYGSFGTTTNYVSLNFVIDSFDPDVTLTVDGGGDVWALVVYYSLNQGEYILEEFYWDTGISDFTLTNVYTFDTQSSFGTAVNIDSDYDGNFIIIWDVAGVLYSLNGDVLSGGVTFHTISKPGTFGSGTYPDVCLHHSSSDVVIYSYIDSGDLIVDQDSYSSLSGGTSTPTLMLQHTPTHTYYTTRIACPGVNVGSAGDWSVVALDTDGSTDWIITGHNFNSTNGMNSPIIYNDGWWHSHPALFNEENDFPVVTYDDQGNIFVGWTFNNLSNNHATTDAIYPIVLQCDYNGDPIANIDYWDVPVSLSSSDVKNCISLSGRHANDVLFCTYLDDIAQDVYTKAVTGAPASGSLKVLSSNNQSSGLHELYLTNDFMILGKLYDLKGKLLFHYQGSSHDFMKNTLMILNNRKKSVYLIEIISNDGKYVQKTKVFAGE